MNNSMSLFKFIDRLQSECAYGGHLIYALVKRQGGIGPAYLKLIRIIKNEGVGGVLDRFSKKSAGNVKSVLSQKKSLSNHINSANEIPRVNFDEKSESYVNYRSNKQILPSVKVIAFYLPQFHPFPENDEWWGKGFTEWSNVGKALPNYIGHYQPHCPIHFGYYDLRISSIMEEQAKIAKEYGLYGFSYYFYWFAGKVLMETPLIQMLENKTINLPFCLTWANENWSRSWDGQENDILIAQKHSDEDSIEFIKYLLKYFRDSRYIKIDGKPLLIVYRANIIPNIKKTAQIWRDMVVLEGFPGIYLVSAQTFGIKSPYEFGFDASVEFPPHTADNTDISDSINIVNKDFSGHIFSYDLTVSKAVTDDEPSYKLFRTAMLSWDNTARKQNNSHIFYGFSISRYKQWFSSIVNRIHTNEKYCGDEKLVFVNAWNEWAEGTHLEPDRKYGFAYLQATYDVLKNYDLNNNLPNYNPVKTSPIAIVLHIHYTEVWPEICQVIKCAFVSIEFDLFVTGTSSKALSLVYNDFPQANLMLVDNRGRDIFPFIKILKSIVDLGYSAVCKIHSKRSLYRDDGESIRNELLQSLIGSAEQVRTIIAGFENNERLGMVVPKKYLLEHNDINMTYDHEIIRSLSKLLDIRFKYGVFPAGSMFWFKPESLKPLLKLYSGREFDVESGLADGTTAHGIERLFCTIAEQAGYTVKNCE
jgi:lipopolysaccharide biosynthesis protein